MDGHKRRVTRMFALLAVVLLIINIGGLSMSLRSPALQSDSGTYFENDITLNESELSDSVQRIDGESESEYAIRVTHVVNNGIAHTWDDQDISRYNLRVPIWENYLLYGLSYVYPKFYEKYRYDYFASKGMERGVGWCAQHATIVRNLLQREGIEAHLVGLKGHVVTMAFLDGQWYILDADYGVVIPHPLSTVENNKSLVREYYNSDDIQIREQLAYDVEGWAVDVYVDNDNEVFHSGPLLGCGLKRCYIEVLSYVLKWTIPILLFFPYVLYARSEIED